MYSSKWTHHGRLRYTPLCDNGQRNICFQNKHGHIYAKESFSYMQAQHLQTLNLVRKHGNSKSMQQIRPSNEKFSN